MTKSRKVGKQDKISPQKWEKQESRKKGKVQKEKSPHPLPSQNPPPRQTVAIATVRGIETEQRVRKTKWYKLGQRVIFSRELRNEADAKIPISIILKTGIPIPRLSMGTRVSNFQGTTLVEIAKVTERQNDGGGYRKQRDNNLKPFTGRKRDGEMRVKTRVTLDFAGNIFGLGGEIFSGQGVKYFRRCAQHRLYWVGRGREGDNKRRCKARSSKRRRGGDSVEGAKWQREGAKWQREGNLVLCVDGAKLSGKDNYSAIESGKKRCEVRVEEKNLDNFTG